jgi:hypothetical protein
VELEIQAMKKEIDTSYSKLIKQEEEDPLKNRRGSNRYTVQLAALLILVFLTAHSSFAAPGGKKGKPGGGGGGGGGSECSADARFPALIYSEDADFGNGTEDVVVASSDGCVTLTVEQGIQLGGARLKYDETTGYGYYAWVENVYPGYAPGTIRRQHFTVTDGSLTKTPKIENLYAGVDYLSSFDLQGDLLAVVDEQSGQPTLLVIDLSTCGGLPCYGSDAVSVYTPTATSVPCLQDADADVVGCYQPESGLTMALDGNAIYFDVLGHDSGGNQVYGIARVTQEGGVWAPQTPDLFLRDDCYFEARVYGLSEDGHYLAIGYLAGFQNRLRDDRVVIFDTNDIGGACPSEVAGFSQDFSAWTATWTEEDTFYVLGTEGKGRKLKHPIEEFDPLTGARRSLGISIENHPGIDSSL